MYKLEITIKTGKEHYTRKTNKEVLIKAVERDELKRKTLDPTASGEGWTLYSDDSFITIYHLKDIYVKVKTP